MKKCKKRNLKILVAYCMPKASTVTIAVRNTMPSGYYHRNTVTIIDYSDELTPKQSIGGIKIDKI